MKELNTNSVIKLTKLLDSGKKDLGVLLGCVNVETIKEFEENAKEIKEKYTYHQYNDIVKQIKYISKIEDAIEKIKQENIKEKNKYKRKE
jgi:hypothetical protein